MMKKYILLIGLIILMGYISCGGNTAPIITDIAFNPNQPSPGSDVTCTVSATDEDGDPLTYAWSANNGTFASNTGNPVTWTAPNSEGTYSIEVEASDGVDIDTYSENIQVATGVGSVSGSNPNSIQILDGYYSALGITISGAPAGAEVDSITFTINIDHTSYSDLTVDMYAPDSVYTRYWEFNYPGGSQTRTSSILAGRPVNGDWWLTVTDWIMNGEEGMFNGWNITIYYEE
jgi:hypothetical protein